MGWASFPHSYSTNSERFISNWRFWVPGENLKQIQFFIQPYMWDEDGEKEEIMDRVGMEWEMERAKKKKKESV